MRQAFSKFELRALSSMIAVVILLGGFSLAAGAIVVSGPSHPELTVNICQPLQSSAPAASVLLARPAIVSMSDVVLADLGSLVVSALTRTSADSSGPDTPPPKPLV